MKRLLLSLCLLLTMTQLACSSDVSLVWDASVSTGVVGYRVYVGTASRAYGTPTTVGNVTAYTVPSLSPGTYFFAVTAFDADGNESDFSNEVSQKITILSPPSNLKATIKK